MRAQKISKCPAKPNFTPKPVIGKTHENFVRWRLFLTNRAPLLCPTINGIENIRKQSCEKTSGTSCGPMTMPTTNSAHPPTAGLDPNLPHPSLPTFLHHSLVIKNTHPFHFFGLPTTHVLRADDRRQPELEVHNSSISLRDAAVIYPKPPQAHALHTRLSFSCVPADNAGFLHG